MEGGIECRVSEGFRVDRKRQLALWATSRGARHAYAHSTADGGTSAATHPGKLSRG